MPLLQCKSCRRIFNVFTGTLFEGSKRSLSDLVAILRGVLQGVSTNQLCAELGCDHSALLKFRHKLQDSVFWQNQLGVTGLPLIRTVAGKIWFGSCPGGTAGDWTLLLSGPKAHSIPAWGNAPGREEIKWKG